MQRSRRRDAHACTSLLRRPALGRELRGEARPWGAALWREAPGAEGLQGSQAEAQSLAAACQGETAAITTQASGICHALQ